MVGSNQAFVFSPNGLILVDKRDELETELETKTDENEVIQRKTWKTSKEETDPSKRIYETTIPTQITKTTDVNILSSYIAELPAIKTNKTCNTRKERLENATKYHHLIFNILKILFEDRLKRPMMEENFDCGTQRVDITFQNCRERGFFKQLDEGYHITCPNIFIECKNYEGDLKNPEFSQIHNRLNKIRGQFGILVCRHFKDWATATIRQGVLAKNGCYVIILVDDDVKKLVKFKLSNQLDEMDQYIEEKFKPLV
jgi:hypothetical protein